MNWTDFFKDQRRWAVIMVLVLTVGTGWTLVTRLPDAGVKAAGQKATPREGFPAPDFTLDLLDGGYITLSELRGKLVVVNLWASWCSPCRAEMPAIQKVYQDYQGLGLVVLGVNATNQDNEAEAAAFVREYGLTFPIPLDRDGSVSIRYDLRGLPTTFFIDRKGIIRSVVVGGPMSEAVIRSKVESLLKVTP